MKIYVNEKRKTGVRDRKLYGHFIEHFHRQIYGGIYDPGNPLSDEQGFRRDIIDAMKKIGVPVLRWPGGCFVSSYHWKDGVGPERTPVFDKAWRVEDPNTFGTDEYISLCRKIGCEPYICTNAGTGTAEEMSDWVEYCNLKKEGRYARERIRNGFTDPHKVTYWSIGNENYGAWEIGAKSADEWGRLVREAAKMMRHADPSIQLSAAAISDVNWTFHLLQTCGQYLDWISIHEYWDMVPEKNNLADYEACMAYTDGVDHQIRVVRGMLEALGLSGKIKIAFDEWNLRSWHHPNVHTIQLADDPSEYLTPRDKNDDNSSYTMADAVFAACFLNAMNRNCDLVKMANFAPVLNTRGCIYSYGEGIVLRSTYHVFDLYTNYLGDTVIDLWSPDRNPVWEVKDKSGNTKEIEVLDLLATAWSDRSGIAISAVNKHSEEEAFLELDESFEGRKMTVYTLNGKSTDSYNDIYRTDVCIQKTKECSYERGMAVRLAPHSVNIIQIM